MVPRKIKIRLTRALLSFSCIAFTKNTSFFYSINKLSFVNIKAIQKALFNELQHQKYCIIWISTLLKRVNLLKTGLWHPAPFDVAASGPWIHCLLYNTKESFTNRFSGYSIKLAFDFYKTRFSENVCQAWLSTNERYSACVYRFCPFSDLFSSPIICFGGFIFINLRCCGFSQVFRCA